MKNKFIVVMTLVFAFGLVFVVSRANAHADTNNSDNNEQDGGIIVQTQTTNQMGTSRVDSQDSKNENDHSNSKDSSSNSKKEDNKQNKSEKELGDKQDNNSNSEDSSSKKEDNKQNESDNNNNSNPKNSSNGQESNDQNENKMENKNEYEDYQKMSEDRKSIVANAVEGMLKIADNNKGIGKQVRVIAQDQNLYRNAIEKSLGEAEDRSSLAKFFIGPNYNKINNAKKLLQKSQLQVDQLNQIKSQVTNQDVAKKLTNQITLLKKVSDQTEKLIKESESTFSLFGWFVKIFS